MSASDVYNFEGIVELSAQKVLQAMQLVAATSLDSPQFQKQRPRVEVKCTMGPGLQRFVPVINGQLITNDTPNVNPKLLFFSRRESAWSFRIQFDLITSFNIQEHIGYRSTIRNALAQFWVLVNNVQPMTNHCIQLAKDNGSSPILEAPEQGLLKTEISFDGNLSIQAYAWAQLLS